MKNSEMQIWDLLSDYWDKRMGEEGDWYYKNVVHPPVFKLIGKLEGLKILDAGCGTGSLSRVLAKRGATVVGVDYSAGMIKHAMRREKEKPLNIRYYCFRLKHLSKHLEESFDAVIADFTIQDIKSYRKILKELRKTISNNGKLIISLEHPCFTIFDDLHVTTKREWVGCKYSGKKCLDTLGRYKNCKKTRIIWKKGLSTISYHRALEEYSAALHDSGFLISRFIEPTVPVALALKGPKNNLSYKVPMFLIIEALPVINATRTKTRRQLVTARDI